MTENEVFRLSLITMKNTYLIQTEPIGAAWAWISRDFVQSHTLVKVISELCKGTTSNIDCANIDDAWLFIDKVVARIPPIRRRDPEISPILNLMSLARRRRLDSLNRAGYQVQQGQATYSTINTPTDGFSDTQLFLTFSDAWAANAMTWSSKFLEAAVPIPESMVNEEESMQSSSFEHAHGLDSLAEFPEFDLSVANVDWDWNGSQNVFNTTFAPP